MTDKVKYVRIVQESSLSPFEKWWRDHTIDWDRSFSLEERALAEAAFDAGARLDSKSHRRH
jgi:hypothetical protein